MKFKIYAEMIIEAETKEKALKKVQCLLDGTYQRTAPTLGFAISTEKKKDELE